MVSLNRMAERAGSASSSKEPVAPPAHPPSTEVQADEPLEAPPSASPFISRTGPRSAESILLALSIPHELFSHYESAASAAGIPLTDYIVQRLSRCAPHDSAGGLYVDDAMRHRLGPKLNSSLTSAEELEGGVNRLTGIKVLAADREIVEVHMDAEMVRRVGYSLSSAVSYEDRVREIVLWGLRNRLF